ncbi:MAG: hypothetical protein ACM33U_09125 [Solirubrobacterales bacterium]|nr:hypothetical protein [Solirubrobacterales bacterium]
MIRADLASVPERRESLERTVRSLLPQVDRVGVYLNGYEDVPDCLADPRVDVARSQEHGDRGDTGKFWWSGSAELQLCCDDDLEYPPDYVERLVEGLRRHAGAACSFHGHLLRPPFNSISRARTYHCLRRVDGDHQVHVAGTGVIGFCHDAISISPADFEHPNMADIWFACAAQRQRVRLFALAHEAGWLKHTAHERTIWSESKARTGSAMDTLERKAYVVRSTRWRLP